MTADPAESVAMNEEAASHQETREHVRPRTSFRTMCSSRQGFSMTEMVIAISVIGVLAAIVIPAYVGLISGSKEALANEKLEMLNQGLNDYAHAFKEYTRTPNNGSYSDELTIVNDLEYRDPDDNKALVGSPFVRTTYRPEGSSSTDDYRFIWTGYRFKLLRPGDLGSGIKVVFDGSDNGTPFVYPSNYSSSGR